MKILRGLLIVLGSLSLLTVATLITGYFATDHLRTFGSAPDRATFARMHLSPQFHDDHFANPEPTDVLGGMRWPVLRHWLFGKEMRVPTCQLPRVKDVKARLARPSRSKLRITWLGHSTTLIELDGARILTDPQWSERTSPVSFLGPRRFHPPPIAIGDLPELDAVLISHEHYDHLDMASVRALAGTGVTFHAPLGVRAHLLSWGVPAEQIVEHDWWQAALLPNGVRVTSTPARHFNGRGVPGRIGALWTSWSLVGPEHRVFFSGDTGLTQNMLEIGALHGPFDVALLEIGQWDASWSDIHLGPRGALDAQKTLRAERLLPIHWGTFELAFHAWSEPIETLVREGERRKAKLVTPMLGEPVEPTLDEVGTKWWRALPPMAASCPKTQ